MESGEDDDFIADSYLQDVERMQANPEANADYFKDVLILTEEELVRRRRERIITLLREYPN